MTGPVRTVHVVSLLGFRNRKKARQIFLETERKEVNSYKDSTFIMKDPKLNVLVMNKKIPATYVLHCILLQTGRTVLYMNNKKLKEGTLLY